MKNIILILVSCAVTYFLTKSEEKIVKEAEKIQEDSVVIKIKQRHKELGQAMEAGDAKVTQVIDKAASTITTLKGKVSELQTKVAKLTKENNELKKIIDAANTDFGSNFKLLPISKENRQ